MAKNDSLIQKHVFETIDYLLDSSVYEFYKPNLANQNTKMKDLQITRDTLFFSHFQVYIGAEIDMTEFWPNNKVALLTIKEFKSLVLRKYMFIQKETQKAIPQKRLINAIMDQYETFTPAALIELKAFIKNNSKKR